MKIRLYILQWIILKRKSRIWKIFDNYKVIEDLHN